MKRGERIEIKSEKTTNKTIVNYYGTDDPNKFIWY